MHSGMPASDIRTRFLTYFQRNGHSIRPSSSLVPADDPTLLFTNAGMVQFKRIFLGQERSDFGARATTSQKCVRAGGKHNDLEQVGHTVRHHTFFEMLGNFSFGDYFKREAIRFAWDFVTGELGVARESLRVSVYRSDDEARALWREIAKLPDSRIYGLGEADNFWQMADTGPCGPCTELYVDLAGLTDWKVPPGASGEWTDISRTEFSQDAFVEGAEAGRFVEIWNLVFMQYDRRPDGELSPLPKPSVDTGAGLERIAAVMQGVSNNFHTDLFAPLIEAVAKAVGFPYEPDRPAYKVTIAGLRDEPSVPAGDGLIGRPSVRQEATIDAASYRVLADHARAVAFLLADGVFPSNDGRGYVLRRILRRGVRHAWLMGRAEPTLIHVVRAVIDTMGAVYPELTLRAKHILDITRAEEERFLETIAAGMTRFDALAPALPTAHGTPTLRGTISGEDAFKLYDTFGFPIDLTELMARERGYTVDTAEFERALDAQRTQSKDERRSRKLTVAADELGDADTWESPPDAHLAASFAPDERAAQEFVGYDELENKTRVVARRLLSDGRTAVVLARRPFYLESGGQVSDRGEIVGNGWRMQVEDVRRAGRRVAEIGTVEGGFEFGNVVARVPRDIRLDTERNHTATHLLHAALRQVLGAHVHQRGSLVAPDRLRFDFSHTGPLEAGELAEVEDLINREIARAIPVTWTEKPYAVAVSEGAMALFGEKYGDVVRVVSVPGFSMELCGGTHVRNTSEILLCKIVSETGVGGGLRRIEAVTGPTAYARTREYDRAVARMAEALRVPAGDAAAVAARVEQVIADRRALERRLGELLRDGADGGGPGGQARDLIQNAEVVAGAQVVAARVNAPDLKALQALGDSVRGQLRSGIAVLAAAFDDGKSTLLVVVTDDLRARGIRADIIVREIVAVTGGKGGGKPHMAQAGLPDAARIPAALEAVMPVVRPILNGGPGRSAA